MERIQGEWAFIYIDVYLHYRCWGYEIEKRKEALFWKRSMWTSQFINENHTPNYSFLYLLLHNTFFRRLHDGKRIDCYSLRLSLSLVFCSTNRWDDGYKYFWYVHHWPNPHSLFHSLPQSVDWTSSLWNLFCWPSRLSSESSFIYSIRSLEAQLFSSIERDWPAIHCMILLSWWIPTSLNSIHSHNSPIIFMRLQISWIMHSWRASRSVFFIRR